MITTWGITITMTLALIISFSAFLHGTSAIVSDGVTLLSLLTHWTFVPPIINLTWNASDSIPCSWVGVQCNHAQSVVSLNLSDHGIFGQLGPEIGKLNHLKTLVLLGNGFSGSVPSELSNCSLLEYLDLSENNFSGHLPHSLKKLQNLHYMSLSSNMLSGEIPYSLFQIASLVEVSLHGNLLSGPIPTNIGNLTQLLRLYLYGNQLSGTIPSSIGNYSKLEVLEVSFNHLTGEIPISVWRIPSLKHILVHNNSLFGELPWEMTKLKHLENISLFENQFSGVIPQSLGINSSLVKLDFMNNKFTGQIPPNLCFGKQLLVLNMGINQLHGGIPSDLGRCASLWRLTLNENNFTGSLPDFESNLNLTYMYISKNSISGPIPSSLGNCTSITAINLSMNKLTGLIPPELGKLVNLVILDLAHNNLEGPLPPQLSNCTKMDRFDVGFNFLNGSLPSNLRSWKGITTLILRENRFMGGIPDFLSEFITLRELQLGGNLFGGKIPRSLGKLHNIFYGLNLSASGLTGDIPSEFGALQVLQSLDVSLNNLTGSIDVLGSLISLIEVNISYNFFHGPIPKHLMKLLNSTPSSFMGNPLLCVSCSPSDGLSCIKTSYVKPCVNGSADHRGINKFGIVMIELVSSIFISALLVLMILMYLHKQELKRDLAAKQWRLLDRISCTESFLRDQILQAANNLNECCIIGRGAHGVVYRAQPSGNGMTLAVKKFAFERENRKLVRMMHKEVETLEMIKHRNLIQYVGCLIKQDYGLIFSKYMENGSLHDLLHEKQPPPPLPWTVRLRIAVGIAQGLAYLHYDCVPRIVHRDIKPRNILLDDNMEPLIADFGTALFRNLSEHSYSHSDTRKNRSTCIVGTTGYMAPENAYDIVQSRKSDVYSYGVVLLELITRRKVLVTDHTHIVSWARSLWMQTGQIEKIVDPYLTIAFHDPVLVAKQITEVLRLALVCTARDVRERPTMKDVVSLYNNRMFQLRCDVAPQPYSSLSLFPDVAAVTVDQDLHGQSCRASNLRHTQMSYGVVAENEDSYFSYWEEANEFPLEVFVWDAWKVMSRPASGITGLAIKLKGNGKIWAQQVMVAALIVPKITYIWPGLVFLPSLLGPVLTKPFNWFFLLRFAQYMHLQKSLDSETKSYFEITNKANGDAAPQSSSSLSLFPDVPIEATTYQTLQLVFPLTSGSIYALKEILHNPNPTVKGPIKATLLLGE